MASENAKAVAQEVIRKVRTGKIVNFQEIQKKNGYSDNSAKSMKAKKTKTYQKEIKPLADRLKNEIDKIQLEMESRNLSKEKYKELSEVQDKKIKNFQLLTGNPTDRTETIPIDEEELQAYIKWAKSRIK